MASLITCPHCGVRPKEEFSIRGDAVPVRPAASGFHGSALPVPNSTRLVAGPAAATAINAGVLQVGNAGAAGACGLVRGVAGSATVPKHRAQSCGQLQG